MSTYLCVAHHVDAVKASGGAREDICPISAVYNGSRIKPAPDMLSFIEWTAQRSPHCEGRVCGTAYRRNSHIS